MEGVKFLFIFCLGRYFNRIKNAVPATLLPALTTDKLLV